MLGADGVYTRAAASSASALVATSATPAAVRDVNDELVRDLCLLKLGDVPLVGSADKGPTNVSALEIDCLASFSYSAKPLIDSSSAQKRSNFVLQASGSA